jgi:hypothetical protein
MSAGSNQPADMPPVPRPLVAVVTLGAAVVVIAVTVWLATTPGAERAQTGVVKWFNDPPQPVAAVFAVVNPLFRPIPLTLLTVAFVGWVLLTAGRARLRVEIWCPRCVRRRSGQDREGHVLLRWSPATAPAGKPVLGRVICAAMRRREHSDRSPREQRPRCPTTRPSAGRVSQSPAARGTVGGDS